MTVAPPPPLLKRLPPGLWVALFWLMIILVRALQRPGELHHLLDYNGNTEGAPLLVTAVVTTLGTLLLFRAPLAAVAAVLAGAVFSYEMWVRETPYVLFLLSDGLVGYITASRERRISLLAALLPVGTVAGYTVWDVLAGYPVSITKSLTLVATVAIAWLIGNTIRQSRAHAETMRLQATQQAVTEERLRIARELHDMVAHNIGIIAIQAGVGRRVMSNRPEQTRIALGAIETTSRETLSGLRRMLGALRKTDAQAAAPGEPVSGLAHVDQLVARTKDVGVRVDVRRRGEPRSLPAEVDLAAFRIVQEAVTNVVRHSGTKDCSVTLDYRPDELVVEVVDLGCGGVAGSPGYGLVGMRERVSLLHGQFSAGLRPEGGFRVAARLPVPVEAAE
ncbi:sensor histidine kinase [Streptomyces yaanensis]|uniref:histidine kinase n=1 Tax=Streptomyces yaanensis TaxID=1142239 RepID=A0ABV7SNH4_9ACTN|nr:histidine kinase [Streptomyces sp. CGMCC 4.7035]WNB97187.1 histidine kinase [Streptomyces sp. CGMCC 4.7035]